MKKEGKRKYYRYDTEIKAYFRRGYDIETRVNFQVLEAYKPKHISKKYSGITKNISVEGLRFVSKKKLRKGDILFLEVYAPNVKVPVQMTGQVRWCQKTPQKSKFRNKFDTGVKLISVKGKSLPESIHFDANYHIQWSRVLEAVFGSYKTTIKSLKK